MSVLRAMRADEHDVTLEQSRLPRGSVQGELIARKLTVRVSSAVVRRNARLRAALENSKPGLPLALNIQTEAISIEAVARSLEWLARPAMERQLLDHSSWQYISTIMHAATWLGCSGLATACETKLLAALSLENAVLLARAAHRCSARRLLSGAFYLLKAFFCAEFEEARAAGAARARVHAALSTLPRCSPDLHTPARSSSERSLSGVRTGSASESGWAQLPHPSASGEVDRTARQRDRAPRHVEACDCELRGGSGAAVCSEAVLHAVHAHPRAAG